MSDVMLIGRWMLLCFKREFVESDALRLWEACWARHHTDYFHLFVCAAVIAVYGEDVVQQDLMADEMLLHFSSLSMHMSGEVVLRKVACFTFLDNWSMHPLNAGYDHQDVHCTTTLTYDAHRLQQLIMRDTTVVGGVAQW